MKQREGEKTVWNTLNCCCLESLFLLYVEMCKEFLEESVCSLD